MVGPSFSWHLGRMIGRKGDLSSGSGFEDDLINEFDSKIILSRQISALKNRAHEIKMIPKWVRMLKRELRERACYEGMSFSEWNLLLQKRNVTSLNHDTVLSLDWPHYCTESSEACGGPNGWCYTFLGPQASRYHIRKVAMVDVLAVEFPELFAENVVDEVLRAMKKGLILDPNIRYSGSGELRQEHVRALSLVREKGLSLWGFTRNITIAEALRRSDIAVIYSYDKYTPSNKVMDARNKGFRLAYTSLGVDDFPPVPSFVVFPLHRSGNVPEVVDAVNLCPKVVNEYFCHKRSVGTCQTLCKRCHEL